MTLPALEHTRPKKGPLTMLLTALMAFSNGELTPEQVRWLHEALRLEENTPRTEGYAAGASIAHRTFTDDEGHRLVLDLGRIGEDTWSFGLHFEKGERPSTETVENHRALFRELMSQFGLTLHKIDPPATADEVGRTFVPPRPDNREEDTLGLAWDLPYDELDHMWFHLGVGKDAPREVKEVKLRELMSTRVWSVAPERLRSQAEEFLRDA
ncbi:hypothetical protein [Nocardiopsis sp. M1B1]|uniref:hypothetical protein n=1 Tax=Nocardiopsis sp. M1B1 TaxID=3450454 RepID=UPI004039702C